MTRIADFSMIQLRKQYPSVKPEKTQDDQIKINDCVLNYSINSNEKEENAGDKIDVHSQMNRAFAPVKQVILK